jgi:Fe-Mn family superoxide dismutase
LAYAIAALKRGNMAISHIFCFVMPYQSKNYENLLGIKGLSDKLLNNHFSLYEGYVKNTNKLFEALDELHDANKAGSPQFAELKRRLGWEFNGRRLHELYFENLTKDFKELDINSSFYKKIEAGYDNFNYWLEDFKATASMRGIGWVILYYDKKDGCLINSWINEHDAGHPAGCAPLLVMDIFEHAYMIDYGLKRADYIETFLAAIDWQAVADRFEKALT